MAPTQAEVDQYRSALSDVNTLTQQALLTVWSALDTEDIDGTVTALSEALPEVADEMSGLAATVAADQYEVWRDDAKVSSPFTPVLAAAPEPGRLITLARWASGPLYPTPGTTYRNNIGLLLKGPAKPPQPDVALSKLSGGLQRVVADRARQTVVLSARRDPAEVRWRRVTSAKACDFCRLLANRGAVYSQDTSDFASHDHCGCGAVPDFGGLADRVAVREYEPSQKFATQDARNANNARIRDYLRKNPQA